jgi:ankyrin repeat protein
MCKGQAINSVRSTKGGLTLGHLCAEEGWHTRLALLLVQGLNVDAVDDNGDTAAHVSARHGHLECLYALGSHFPNFSILNNAGQSVEEEAQAHGHVNCVLYIRQVILFYREREFEFTKLLFTCFRLI